MELKLDVDPHTAAGLAADLAGLFGKPQSATLTSVYYDTPDGALRAAGVSLRVRTGGGGPVQTVKRSAGPSAGLFDREEWESTLSDDRPHLPAFARTPAGAAVSIDPANLAPAFQTRVERAVWRASSADRDVEIAFDKGLVAARGRTEAFAELELELKRGEPQHLFALLRRLPPAGRLRPGVQTKSERGYALAADEPQRAHKAEALDLAKRMDAARAFQAIVHACLRHFWLNEPILVATRAPEALHQTRVALRRLRSALSLFKPVVADEAYDRLRIALQDISRRLGEARNLDVYLKSAARPEVEVTQAEPDATQYLSAIESRRTEAYDQVIERLRGRAFRDTMTDLLAWTEVGAWLVEDDPVRRARRDTPVRAFAAALLDRRRRRVRRRGRHLDTVDAPARHRVRIEAKQLRYAADFFAGLAQGRKARHRQAAFTHALEELQDQLGALNDIATGHAIARGFAEDQHGLQGGVATALSVAARQDTGVDRLLADAAEAHGRFAETKRFWSSWPR